MMCRNYLILLAFVGCMGGCAASRAVDKAQVPTGYERAPSGLEGAIEEGIPVLRGGGAPTS